MNSHRFVAVFMIAGMIVVGGTIALAAYIYLVISDLPFFRKEKNV